MRQTHRGCARAYRTCEVIPRAESASYCVRFAGSLMVVEHRFAVSAYLMPVFPAMPARSPSNFVQNRTSLLDYLKRVCVGRGEHGRQFGRLRLLCQSDLFAVIENAYFNSAEMTDFDGVVITRDDLLVHRTQTVNDRFTSNGKSVHVGSARRTSPAGLRRCQR